STSFDRASEMFPARDMVFTGYGDGMNVAALERELEAAARARASMPDREGVGAPGGGGEDGSDQAGEGTHDGGVAGEWDRLETPRDGMTMEWSGDVRDGRRITVDVPPDPVYSQVAHIDVDGATWVRQGEEPVSGESVPFRYRAAVRDYFLALIQPED